MAYNNQTSSIRTDKFGNPYQLKLAGQVTNKKSGEIIENAFKCYFEASGGKLYKVEVGMANKQTKDGRNGVWVKMTSVKKQVRAAATSF